MSDAMKLVRFTFDEADKASNAWGMNCGPGAAAAILGLTLDQVRPLLGDFETKWYTNPTLMWSILNNAKATFIQKRPAEEWPTHGLVRIQWTGPWTKPGVPVRAAYRHTHWVGARTAIDGYTEVFDINCICVGGWVSELEWKSSVVPWLIREGVPKGDGGWFMTHSVEVVANVP